MSCHLSAQPRPPPLYLGREPTPQMVSQPAHQLVRCTPPSAQMSCYRRALCLNSTPSSFLAARLPWFTLPRSVQHLTSHLYLSSVSCHQASRSFRAGTRCSLLPPQHPGVPVLAPPLWHFARPAVTERRPASTTTEMCCLTVWRPHVQDQVGGRASSSRGCEGGSVPGGSSRFSRSAVSGSLIYNCVTTISAPSSGGGLPFSQGHQSHWRRSHPT